MPTFRTPVVEDVQRGDLESFDPGQRLFGHYRGQMVGQTVWKDENGEWQMGLYPYQGGPSSRTFHDGVLVEESSSSGLATAQEVYLGGHEHEVTHAKAAELMAAGFHVGGRNEEEQQRYIDYAIASTNNFDYKGGDCCASALLPSGDSFVVFADTVVGTVNAQGRYVTFFVTSNSAWLQNPAGAITMQFHPGGNIQAFPHAAPPRFYWPLDTWMSPGQTLPYILCAEGEPVGGIFPAVIGTVILQINFLGGIDVVHTYPSHALFEPRTITVGPTHHYMIGVGNRLARVINGSVLTFAAWEYWNGSTWVSDPAAARPFSTKENEPLNGWVDMRMVGDKYVLAEVQLYKNGLFLYVADQPEGPWNQYHEEPFDSLINGAMLDRREFWFYYAPHWHEHRDPSSNTMFLSFNRNVFPHNVSQQSSAIGQHVDKHIPQFMWVPKP